jgi:tryptophanyl-tRNA synthetase
VDNRVYFILPFNFGTINHMEREKKIVLTGDRPTGRLHLGHFVGSIQNRLKLQEEGGENFYMVADMQALTDNADNPQKVHENVLEVAMDNLACGLDPEKVTMFIQSQVPEIALLYQVFMNLVTLQQISHNPTVKTEAGEKGFSMNSKFTGETENENEAGIPLGFLSYPVSQAADILFAKANTVPVGEDQMPVIEQTNEIVKKFNSLYGEVFEKVTGIVGDTPRLVGIDGDAKASKSKNNAIYLSDSREEIEAKVMKMYTDPDHVNVEDPGKVEGNVVFEYLTIFDPNQNEIEELKKQYAAGGLGDVVLKKRLVDVLDSIIEPIRERRRKFEQSPDTVIEMLRQGTERARLRAQKTLTEVMSAMEITYFE